MPNATSADATDETIDALRARVTQLETAIVETADMQTRLRRLASKNLAHAVYCGWAEEDNECDCGALAHAVRHAYDDPCPENTPC